MSGLCCLFVYADQCYAARIIGLTIANKCADSAFLHIYLCIFVSILIFE